MNLNSFEKEVLDSIDKDEVASFLQAIIQQRSDSPSGDCRKAMAVVSEKLSEEGIIFDIFCRQEQLPNLIASFGNDEGTQSQLMYHAHIDTVSPGELDRWSVDPFGGEIIDGHIYGRGAGDDKGSVASQVMALVALARAKATLSGCLKVVVVSDEELGGSNGTRWLHDQGNLKTEALVVGEQTDNQVAIAERVACGIDITIFGKSAHGAMPWEGENAVLKAARAITYLHDHLFPILEARTHPYLPSPTLCVCKIEGGQQWGVVPERCKIETDRRLIPGETREMAMEEIRKVFDEYAASVEPLNFELFLPGRLPQTLIRLRMIHS